MASVSILHTAQPYRESTDNTVVVSGQTLVYWWLFLLLLRIVRVGEGGATIFGCVALVAATAGVFVFALHAILSELRKVDMIGEGSTAATSISVTSDDDEGGSSGDGTDETAPAEPKRGEESPQDTEEIELTVVSRHDDEHLTAPSHAKSPWEFLGLCSAEPEMTQTPEGAQS